ncbi:hypothetical protein AB685_23795 [Bacillus sp. LL01]|nr:hypothetical protein AB685_23795 [Bacillus sp. LL01]
MHPLLFKHQKKHSINGMLYRLATSWLILFLLRGRFATLLCFEAFLEDLRRERTRLTGGRHEVSHRSFFMINPKEKSKKPLLLRTSKLNYAFILFIHQKNHSDKEWF